MQYIQQLKSNTIAEEITGAKIQVSFILDLSEAE